MTGCGGASRRHWGWESTAATFFHFFANYGFLYSYGQFLVIFQAEFDRGVTLTGWLGTIPFGLTYLASPLSNALISRYQHRLIAVVGTFACFLSLLVTSFMPAILPMFLTFSLLYGLGINFVTVSGLNIILRYFPASNSARSVTIALIGCNTGLLAVNPLIYVLNSYFGWRNTMRLASALILATGVAAASTYTRPVHEQCPNKEEGQVTMATVELKPGAESTAPSKAADGGGLATVPAVNEKSDSIADREQLETLLVKETKKWGERSSGDGVAVYREGPRHLSVLRYPELWVIAAALCSCCAAVCFFYMSLVNFLVSRGFDEETSALAMTALGISQVVGKAIVALVGDNLPFRKIFAVVVASVIGAVLMGLLLLVDGLIAIVAVIVCSGVLVVSILDTMPHTLSHQVFHPNLCLVSWTVLTSAMGSGYVVGALLGESMDRTGSYDIALYVCMGFFLSSAVLLSVVPLYQVYCATERYLQSPSGITVTCRIDSAKEIPGTPV